MTSFTFLPATLPNGGIVTRPATTEAGHRATLAHLAQLDDDALRQDRCLTWAHRAHDALNAPLTATASQALTTLGTAEQATRTAIERNRAELGKTEVVKAVISSRQRVERDWNARLFAISGTYGMALAVGFAEAKMLSQIVTVSGVLGLNPDSWWDFIFALAFAMIPLGWGMWKRSVHAQLSSAEERAQHASGLYRLTKILLFAWVGLVALIFGPHLIEPGQDIVDAFAERPAFAETISLIVNETHRIVKHLSALVVIPFMIVAILTASNLVAALWISDREAYARSMHEDVRRPETADFCDDRIKVLTNDQLITDNSIGRLRGLIEQIAADREAFAEQVLHEVEALRTRAQIEGELARRSAILDHAGLSGKVIDAGPLFTRAS